MAQTKQPIKVTTALTGHHIRYAEADVISSNVMKY